MNFIKTVLLSLFFLPFLLSLSKAQTPEKSDIWITAYFASWKHQAPPYGNWGNVETDEIDWNAFTHLTYFAVNVNSDGTITEIQEDYVNMNTSRVNAIVAAGHDHNTPVIMSVGGWGNHEGFSNAIAPSTRGRLVNNLTDLITVWGFDGIDIDMEPILDSDIENYTAFIKQLHDSLQTLQTPLLDAPLLTAATGRQPEMFNSLKQYFDQINLMTYDMSGAWQGWPVWHNAPIYNGGQKFPRVDRTLPSINKEANTFHEAGIPLEKLGIGIDFYGYIWKGVSEPLQTWDWSDWSTYPTVEDNVPYHTIKIQHYEDSFYRWDSIAHVSYLSIKDNETPQFISYDDARTCREKIQYVRKKGLGGAIIWELGGGFIQSRPAGERDPLLQAVKQEAWGDSVGAALPPVTQMPSEYTLGSNYPNPFNSNTQISFSIPEKTHVTLTVYNMLGQKIKVLMDREVPAGSYSATWDASNYASGSYIYRLKTDAFTSSKKMMLVE